MLYIYQIWNTLTFAFKCMCSIPALKNSCTYLVMWRQKKISINLKQIFSSLFSSRRRCFIFLLSTSSPSNGGTFTPTLWLSLQFKPWMLTLQINENLCLLVIAALLASAISILSSIPLTDAGRSRGERRKRTLIWSDRPHQSDLILDTTADVLQSDNKSAADSSDKWGCCSNYKSNKWSDFFVIDSKWIKELTETSAC